MKNTTDNITVINEANVDQETIDQIITGIDAILNDYKNDDEMFGQIGYESDNYHDEQTDITTVEWREAISIWNDLNITVRIKEGIILDLEIRDLVEERMQEMIAYLKDEFLQKEKDVKMLVFVNEEFQEIYEDEFISQTFGLITNEHTIDHWFKKDPNKPVIHFTDEVDGIQIRLATPNED